MIVKMITRDDLLKAKTNANRVVECLVDGFDETFTVLKLSISQRSLMEEKISSIKEDFGDSGFVGEISKWILYYCLCDEEGNKVLEESDLEGLENLPAEYSKVVEECMRVNHMLATQVEDARKKSSPQQAN